jgi:hypothetical protein
MTGYWLDRWDLDSRFWFSVPCPERYWCLPVLMFRRKWSLCSPAEPPKRCIFISAPPSPHLMLRLIFTVSSRTNCFVSLIPNIVDCFIVVTTAPYPTGMFWHVNELLWRLTAHSSGVGLLTAHLIMYSLPLNIFPLLFIFLLPFPVSLIVAFIWNSAN